MNICRNAADGRFISANHMPSVFLLSSKLANRNYTLSPVLSSSSPLSGYGPSFAMATKASNKRVRPSPHADPTFVVISASSFSVSN